MSLPLDDTEANAELPPAIWVFGYGSLVWRPSFPFTHRVEGYIRGYRRRFWQGSTDHRGVPGAPGRVVTCVPPRRDLGEAHSDSDESWRVYGVAYRTEDVAHVLEYLDVREQGGYTRTWVPVYASDQHPPSSPIVERALLYIATDSNPEWLGDAPLHAIAHQIAHSHGPSGSNWHYLSSLAEALREMRVIDEHVFELEAAVHSILQQANQAATTTPPPTTTTTKTP